MKTKTNINEEEAFHLNFGVPIVIGIILLIINLEFFVLFFLENMSEILLIYTYSSLIVIVFIFFMTKRNEEGIRKLSLSFYDLIVHNSALVLVFLLLNYSFSEPIFEKKLMYDQYYDYQLIANEVPQKYRKLFETTYTESKDFYNSHYISVRVDESIFGYEFIDTREFIKK